MLDHVFTDAIGALRDAVEANFLERQAFEERFQSDMLLGDLTWATSYSLPGEGLPARTRADITMDWPTWSQTAYRSWYIDETFDEPPRIDIAIVLRIQGLSTIPDASTMLGVLPEESCSIGNEHLDRSGPTIETMYSHSLEVIEHAIEVTYDGTYELSEEVLADGSGLDDHFAALGGWIAATLVRLGDLDLAFLPQEPDDEL